MDLTVTEDLNEDLTAFWNVEDEMVVDDGPCGNNGGDCMMRMAASPLIMMLIQRLSMDHHLQHTAMMV